MNNVQCNQLFFPRELATAAAGMTLSATSGIATQYLIPNQRNNATFELRESDAISRSQVT